jgi:hypothetical protein
MPERFERIIDRIVESQTKFAVLKLFKENPYVMDNRAGLALWVGRPEEMLGPELEELLKMGVLHRRGAEPGAIYAYTRDQEMRRQIEERWPEISLRASEARSRQEHEKVITSETSSRQPDGQ